MLYITRNVVPTVILYRLYNDFTVYFFYSGGLRATCKKRKVEQKLGALKEGLNISYDAESGDGKTASSK